MKNIILFLGLVANTMASAGTLIECNGLKTIQYGTANMKSDAKLLFELEANGNKSAIARLEGHVFVKTPWDDDGKPEFNSDNAYMGFFKLDSALANPNYRPHRYKNYAQFLNIDAIETTGLEGGMWGYLALDVNNINKDKFHGVYVFQAGDHMGGTLLLTCSKSDLE